MASSTGTFSAFQRVGPSNCGTNSSFSIRRILDLPEQRDEKCVAYSSSSSSPECCPPALPLGPRVACPVIHNYDYNVPCTEILNWQHLGFTTYPNHWSYRSFPLRKEGFSLEIFPKKKRRPMRKKKQRPLFSPHQIQTMEKEFAKQRYVTEDKRAQLALEVNLTETQVKTWFQNRRTKWKKETKDEASVASTPSQGEMEHVFLAMQSANPFCQNICVESLVNPFTVVPQHWVAPVFSNIDLKGSVYP